MCCSCCQWHEPPSLTAPETWPQTCSHPGPICTHAFFRPSAICLGTCHMVAWRTGCGAQCRCTCLCLCQCGDPTLAAPRMSSHVHGNLIHTSASLRHCPLRGTLFPLFTLPEHTHTPCIT